MKKTNSDSKSLIERARNDPTIMMLCHHEYLGDCGKPPPENWEPSIENADLYELNPDFKPKESREKSKSRLTARQNRCNILA